MVDFSQYALAELEQMEAAGGEVIDCHRVLAKTGDNVVGEALRDGGKFYEFDHYPKGDIYDKESHSQFYYHSHREGEHGHFHTFMRPKGMPEGVKPAPVADFEPKEDPDDELSHLVGISMDAYGFPIAVFTTNRWICAETWYQAKDVCELVELFEIDHSRPSWPLNRWVTAMIRLYRPQIRELLLERDEKIAAWQKQHPERNVYEDRELDILSKIDISVDDQIADIQRAIAARTGPECVATAATV